MRCGLLVNDLRRSTQSHLPRSQRGGGKHAVAVIVASAANHVQSGQLTRSAGRHDGRGLADACGLWEIGYHTIVNKFCFKIVANPSCQRAASALVTSAFIVRSLARWFPRALDCVL
eukprot:6204977-Pleurochrysis_carterae.AAC.1